MYYYLIELSLQPYEEGSRLSSPVFSDEHTEAMKNI